MEVANPFLEGVNLQFGGVPIYILEAEIVLGVLYRKGVIPKKGGTLDFRDPTPLGVASRLRRWQVLSRGSSGDRIAGSRRHTGPDLTVRIGVKDRIAKLLLSQIPSYSTLLPF